MNRIAIAAIILAAVAALCAAYALQPGEGEGSEPAPSADAIYVGPDYDTAQGTVKVTGYDAAAGTITFTAAPLDGYQFKCWTDLDGNVLSRSTSHTFPAYQDRDAVAVFEVAGKKTMEYSWQVPSFSSDGTVSYDDTAYLVLEFDTAEYTASINSDVQRSGTMKSPVPASLCSDDGTMALVVSYLKSYTDGLSNLKAAITVLAFVQDAVGYQLDSDQYGTEEFWATPYETLYSGYGDCEDTAILFVSLASALGVDCGFVTFDSDLAGTADSGHMSVAVRLADGEGIGGDAATFSMYGSTWAYGETAFDSDGTAYRPTIGVLSDAYSISMGTFARVTYADGTYTASENVSIPHGTHASGVVIYGAYGDYSHPPAVEMSVGDSFEYTPELSLPSTITAEGDLGWLEFDGTTLKGTATAAGTFTVTLTARSTVGPEQVATQEITIVVSEGAGSADHQLIYGSEGWTVETSEPEKENKLALPALVAAVAALATLLIIARLYA